MSRAVKLDHLPLQSEQDMAAAGPQVPPIGVVLHQPDRSGFVAARGEGLVKRATDYGRIDLDRLWITDLSFEQWKNLTGTRPNTRHSGFFRTPLSNLLDEWAIPEDGSARSADALCGLLTRSANVAGQVFAQYQGIGLPVPRDPFDASSLNSGFGTVFSEAGLTRGPQIEGARNLLPEALSGAWQTGSRSMTAAQIPKGAEIVWMKRNRLEHAIDVLGGDMPSGEWKFLPKDAVGDMLNTLIETRAPALVRMRWQAREGNEFAVDLFGWRKTETSGSAMRRWATLDEAAYISKIADVDIDGALVCSGWADLTEAGKNPRGLASKLLSSFLDSEGQPTLAAGLSWSAGLVSECILGGFLRTPLRRYAPSGAAVWAAWKDRAAMIRAGLVFADAGFAVRSAYLGGLSVLVTEETMGQAIDAAWRAGLVPPLSLVLRHHAQGGHANCTAQTWGGHSAFMAYALSVVSGWRSALVRFDRLIELPAADVEKAYLEIEATL